MAIQLISHPSGDQIPLILDDLGMPIPVLNEFLLSRRHLSTNTLRRNAQEIEVLWKGFQKAQIDFLKRMESAEQLTEAQVCGSTIPSLRRAQMTNRKVVKMEIGALAFNQRLTTARQFLEWCFNVEIASMRWDDWRYEPLRHQKKSVSQWFFDAINSSPPANKRIGKGLKENEISFLLELQDPNNPDSKGNPAVKFRNYVMTKIMLGYGLRPGELLSLRVEDIEIGAIPAIRVQRRIQNPNDKRSLRPQIKRNGRTLIIEDMAFARQLDEYIMVWREMLCERGNAETEYLIVNDEGLPLGQSSVNQLYQLLREKYSKNLPKNLSPKSMRHTFSFRIERDLRESGVEEERRRKILAYLRGDSSLSSQDVYIEQEIEEQAKNTLRSYHDGLNKGSLG